MEKTMKEVEEIEECQYHQLCGGYLDTTKERESGICESCIEEDAIAEAERVRLAKMQTALRKAARVFLHYSTHHMCKTPPDVEKSSANHELYVMCIEALGDEL